MPNTSHRKGYSLERLTEVALHEAGYTVYRPRAGEPNDKGDVLGVHGWTIQCKNQNKLSLGAWLDQTRIQQSNGRSQYHALVTKRKGKGQFKDQLVVMTGEQWLDLVSLTLQKPCNHNGCSNDLPTAPTPSPN